MAAKYNHKGIEFSTSSEFWEKTYRLGNTSGSGSYGRVAAFKAKTLNDFVARNNIKRVLDLGCGDGNQNALFDFPHYTGIDTSETIINKNKALYADTPHREFFQNDCSDGGADTHVYQPDLVVSLDVIFHLIEDELYNAYMNALFHSGNRYAIAFTHKLPAGEPVPETQSDHTKFRDVEGWAIENAPDFQLIDCLPNPYINADDGLGKSPCYFYIFAKTDSQP